MNGPGGARLGDAEAIIGLLLRLRARGIRDLRVLKALETAPRALFVPHVYGDLAYKEIALPIPCGQTMPDPFTVARMMEALGVEPHHRVLEIGAGSGYVTAILARLATKVQACERFKTLAQAAQVRLDALGLAHAKVEWADAFALPPLPGHYDRIVVHAAVAEPEPVWMHSLTGEGRMALARPATPGRAARLALLQPGAAERDICPGALPALVPGLAQGL